MTDRDMLAAARSRIEAMEADIEKAAAEITRLRMTLGVFADTDAWGGASPNGERKFWTPSIKSHPAEFARKALEGP